MTDHFKCSLQKGSRGLNNCLNHQCCCSQKDFCHVLKFQSAVSQFEHFHGLIFLMAVAKRSVINCSELLKIYLFNTAKKPSYVEFVTWKNRFFFVCVLSKVVDGTKRTTPCPPVFSSSPLCSGNKRTDLMLKGWVKTRQTTDRSVRTTKDVSSSALWFLPGFFQHSSITV